MVRAGAGASRIEDQVMTLSALGSVGAGPAVIGAPTAHGNDFQPLLAAMGHGKGGHGHRTQETGAVGAAAGGAPARTLASDSRALVGDVFGALGADTPTETTARQALAAYRGAG
jgi:hypothetical protein